LLLHYKTEDPVSYAATWNQHLRYGGPKAYPNALDRWLDYYKRLGIEAIGSGAVILRRSSGPHWVRAEELPPGHVNPSGEHILSIFESQDYLNGLDDDRSLLAECFRLVEGHRLEQTLTWRDGRYAVQDTFLNLDQGLRFRGEVDGFTLHLLSLCDGRRPLGDVVRQVAQATGTEGEELAPSVIEIVRKLLGMGFLVRT
ncbi:MAG: hypothetical protein HY685_04415, partial [Chloroflexi bacterium]|nr:hypothetical protein [Chloroflexota bacterium]